MFVGHLGAGLLLKKSAKGVNLGALFFAALFLDFLLGFTVPLGIEKVIASPDYKTMLDIRFSFPYSHGLVAVLGWSFGGFVLAWLIWRGAKEQRLTASVVVATAVFSHFVLDALVHVPELPLLGADSLKIGFSLWKYPIAGFAAELLVAAVGLWIYLRTVQLSRPRKIVLISFIVLAAFLSIGGLLVQGPPPKPNEQAVSWILVPLISAALGWWLERRAKS